MPKNLKQTAKNGLSDLNARAKSNGLPKPLKVAEAYNACTHDHFTFRTTAEVDHTQDFIAQDRAVHAIEMGLGIRKPGYNIYVAGYQGTGKTSVIRSFLEKYSKKSEVPNDWIYLYDFENPECPKAITLPRGEARKFKKKMSNLIRDLRIEIPRVLQSEDYENAVNTYLGASNERKNKLYAELEKLAKSHDFAIKSTRVGIETIPVVNGKNLTEKEYSKLSEGDRDEIEKHRAKLEPEVMDFVRKVRNIENETKDYLESLRSDFGLQIVGSIIDPLIHEYTEKEWAPVIEHLNKTKEHVLENLLEFVELEEEAEEGEEVVQQEGSDDRDRFKKYQVNVFIDHSKLKGAPVIMESNPTFYNLFGKIEKNVEHGVYHTDFLMIKPGAIHKANGGYLVLNATDIFKTPPIWETLKRVLRNREAFIEDLGEQMSMLPTSGLRPQPIPLDIKVIMIGNDDIYHVLFEEDEEFPKIFKIKADFDFKMQRTKKNVDAYVSFVATRAHIEELLPFDKSAIAAIVEFSSRIVEDQTLLTTQFGDIKDLTIEADYVAREEGSNQVKRAHVEGALDRKFYRLNLVEEHLLEMVKNEDIILTVDGDHIGQINGLTVYEMGDYSFGKLCRITCTTSISNGGIINIERASRLSGKTHDKGMFIITGFLTAVLAREHSLGLSASVCFEQNYGMIDGDSASTAELIAVLSSMSQIPVAQNFAVTGSINQMGEVQAVGGINEKIEGFYKTCKLIGKGKQFNVIIPAQNVQNLMLHRDTLEAVKSGYLRILPVRHLWEAFELVTGVELGIHHIYESTFAKNSALDRIKNKLDAIYKADERRSKKRESVANTPEPSSKRAAKSGSSKR